MTKRSSVSATSNSGKSTPTPSVAQAQSPSPKSTSVQQSSGPQPYLRYQPPPSPPSSRSSSLERIPRTSSFSSTVVSTSGSTSTSMSTSMSSSSLSSVVPDTPATVYSPEPPPKGRLEPLDASTSSASIDTNISGRSSTYLASASSSANGLDDEGGEETDGSTGWNRRSETTTVEMWPSSSPSSALARKPVNGSRLALAMQPPDSSEESAEDEDEDGMQEHQSRRSSSSGSREEEEYGPDDGGWALVPETLPLQVIKINSPNSVPPSPYQAFPSASRLQNHSESPSRTSLDHTDFSHSPHETDSGSDYNNSDSEDPNDETTRFSPPFEKRSVSSASNHGVAQRAPSISESVQSHSFSHGASSIHEQSALYGNTANSLMHEESTRLSIAAPSFQGSEDGEVGIGLSLLQGMMGGDDDGSDEDEDEDEHPAPSVTNAIPEQGESGPSAQRQSVVSTVRSLPHGDDWDGASDIYEDYYRFSRFSTNPRSSGSTFASMSGPSHMKMSARFSHGSQRGGVPGSSAQVVPPVPVDPRHETHEIESNHTQKRRSADSEASVYTQASKVSSVEPPIDPSRLSAQPLQAHRPMPLDLNGQPSPLLHTRWGSPVSSSSPPSSSAAGQSTFFDGTSRASASSGSLSPGGAASALRQRLEIDRGGPSDGYTDLENRHGDGDGLGRRIVIEDDEEPPAPSDDSPLASPEEEEYEESMDDDATSRRPGPDSLAPLVINESLSPPRENSTAPIPATATSPLSALSTATATPVSPSSPPDLSPPPVQATSQPQHQPRPSLSELRGYAGSESSPNGASIDKPGQRTSMFLPHPNAPKPPPATSDAEGPMYIRAPPPPSQQRSESVVNIIKMSIGRSTVTRVMPTIYGRTDTDLGSATGPVRIVFSIDPLPPLSVPLPSQIPFRNGASPKPAPRRANTESDRTVGQPGSPPISSPRGRSPTTVASPVSASPVKSSPLAAEKPVSVDLPKSAAPIPRPNFFPKAGTSRPRSRSFSGFNTAAAEVSLPLESSQGVGGPPAQKVTRSMSTIAAPTPPSPSSLLSPTSTSPSPPSPPSLGKHSSRTSLRSAHAPSPLSLPQNNSVAALGVRPPLRSPTSPLTSSPLATGSPSNPISRPNLRQTTSRSTLNEASSSTNRPTLSRAAESPAISPVHTRNESLLSISHDRPSLDNDFSRVVSPTPGGRDSLRQKLSLPNLRRNQSRQSTGSGSQDNETVQVQDMDFELVRPNLAQFNQPSGRSSEDSSLGARDTSSIDGRTSNLGDTYRRTDSPAISISSQAPRSSSSETSIDAHRQRELKWVSLMGIVPPAQAKKSKKVKKLLMEGSVPSSVRFLVWSHLTDGKAKGIPGVYAQLGKRTRVSALSDIERDVQKCSTDHPQMQSNQASLLSLLQAYLTMVPDVEYSTGLTLIAGHLLALSPEEDAFWIFVSIMDSYLRPYFASNTTQLEVDAALFSRALESTDAQVAKKVLLDMSVNPVDLCRPWFSTLFVDALPLDYLNRVWDLFLYEGVPFLFRVGLALIYCCRRRVLEAINQDSLFDVLNHPSPNWLPPSPDAFIALAYSFKVKDDDVRKQRIKMEAQVKRQTQTPRASTTTTTTRSLSFPRN
ncbi:rab-GTPase-TBC domain-containing protein [Mycena galericulata]|nr:rab-GTPase-TBC domain-containing protein [Mycena galericulata]